ncbi:MAG: RluA family pseudouridine synthase [Chloroflexales bacterium]|nr:RluA family pseudouridine synthase [Chloroflexales bacterium]
MKEQRTIDAASCALAQSAQADQRLNCTWIANGENEGLEILELLVDPHGEGMRLDRFVALAVETMSRSYARQLIVDGHILVNRCDAKPSQELRVGDRVTIQRPLPQPTDIVPEAIPLDVVYEDQDVIVINKAAGMVVHPAPGHVSGTLVNALLARYPDMIISGDMRPGIVHRLDQDTSGLMVVARHDEAMQFLGEQQRARKMHKAYLLVVEGHFKQWEGVIDAPIGRHPGQRKRQAVVTNGRAARTHYRVLEELGNYSLLEAVLETGRTHQIRVHFAYKSRPVLGDSLYGPRKPRATFGLQRQFLHSYKLGFVLPASGVWREFTISLPNDLAVVIEKIRASAQVR